MREPPCVGTHGGRGRITRAGLALHTAEPLFIVSRSAADDHGAWSLAWLVEHLAGPSALRGP